MSRKRITSRRRNSRRRNSKARRKSRRSPYIRRPNAAQTQRVCQLELLLFELLFDYLDNNIQFYIYLNIFVLFYYLCFY